VSIAAAKVSGPHRMMVILALPYRSIVGALDNPDGQEGREGFVSIQST
jgi:hypothetical protein